MYTCKHRVQLLLLCGVQDLQVFLQHVLHAGFGRGVRLRRVLARHVHGVITRLFWFCLRMFFRFYEAANNDDENDGKMKRILNHAEDDSKSR